MASNKKVMSKYDKKNKNKNWQMVLNKLKFTPNIYIFGGGIMSTVVLEYNKKCLTHVSNKKVQLRNQSFSTNN